MGFEERITAGFQATVAAAGYVQAVIGSEAKALAASWADATREADELDAQRGVIVAAASEYARDLTKFSSNYPAACPPSDTEPGTLSSQELVRRSSQGWVLDEEIVRSMRHDMHSAISAAREGSQRVFGARQTGQAKEHATRALRTLRALEAEASRMEERQQQALARRETDGDELRSAADVKVEQALARQSEAMRRLPPAMTSWTSPSWLSWSPKLAHDHILLGVLRPQPKIPGKNHGFAWDARTPEFASIRDGLQISHRRGDRERAHALARSVLLRALACTAPGKLQLSIFDPTGLGQSVTSLLELGEYDRDLIGGKVWSSGDDLHRMLAEHTAHIELVIQKYLRSQYQTLAVFNAAAGEIAEPSRMLAIFDAPACFDEGAMHELRRIVENGPRCGVSTLLITDEEIQSPYGVLLDVLPKSLRTVRLHLPFASADGAVAFDLLPETDESAPGQVITAIVQQVGKAAQEDTSAAVTFERSFELFNRAAVDGRKRGLPRLTTAVSAIDQATWWTQTTLESVAAPIGQRGARDVATLMFDSSDHAGALLVGRPGSGKSTLLHTFIAGITTLYGPEELELHLIDFREGVEFKVYAANALPHARTVAIESDREFGMSVLEAIHDELAWRGSLLRESTQSHSSLETLRRETGERLPRILLIFDEFQVLFARNDKLGGAAAEQLETLIRQGRGFGIHVLLATQSLSGLDALGSHVPQLLPIRILLPAAEGDAFKVLGEGNTEGSPLTTAGEGILNEAGGAVEANERFRGAVIQEEARGARVAAMRARADAAGFHRRPVVFEGNAPISAQDTPPAQFVDEVRGADARVLRLRFGAPMSIVGSADINLRRESGANVMLVARDAAAEADAFDPFSLPRAVVANVILSAVARRADVDVVDFLPIDEGLEHFVAPLIEASVISVSRRRQVPDLLERIGAEVRRRVDEDDTSSPAKLLTLYGMHRARDFDQDSVDYDSDASLPSVLMQVLRDGPEVGIHTFMWFDTVASISRRLPGGAVREASWRLAGRMSADDSNALIDNDAASTLREQQLVATNEDRGVFQRCTTISVPPTEWIKELLVNTQDKPKEPIE